MILKGILGRFKRVTLPPSHQFQEDLADAVERALAAGVPFSKIERDLTVELETRRHDAAKQAHTP